MSFNTKNIKRDLGSLPIPQYFNSTADDYEPIQGVNGATRTLIYDAAGNSLLTPSNPGFVQLTGSNALKGAVQNVATAGTRVQLGNYACREVTIIAKRANTGRIYVGGIDVSNAVYGVDLGTEGSVTLAVNNTNLIYIDASVSGEGISYVAI